MSKQCVFLRYLMLQCLIPFLQGLISLLRLYKQLIRASRRRIFFLRRGIPLGNARLAQAHERIGRAAAYVVHIAFFPQRAQNRARPTTALRLNRHVAIALQTETHKEAETPPPLQEFRVVHPILAHAYALIVSHFIRDLRADSDILVHVLCDRISTTRSGGPS